MQYLFIGLVSLAGAGMAVQAAANARMGAAVANPIFAACINFLVGGLLLVLIAASGIFGRGQISGMSAAPWWAWLAGLLGASYVTMSIIAVPRIGAAITFASIIFGQLVGAMALDTFGWLNVPQIPLNSWRILGAVLLFLGVILIQHK